MPPAAQRHFVRPPYVEEEGLLPDSRVSWVAADFFAMGGGAETDAEGSVQGGKGHGGVPDADLYVLTRILHDW